MADDGIALGNLTLRQAFPFTQIFRSFFVAIQPSKLFLALFLLILVYGGGRFLDGVWYHVAPASQASFGDLGYAPADNFYGSRQGIFLTFFSYEVQRVNLVCSSVRALQSEGFLISIEQFFIDGPAWFFTEHPAFATIYTLWFLLIWSIFGGAICRIAAVDVTREEKMAVRQALRFSMGKILSFIFAPLLPLGTFIFLGAILALAGFILLHVRFLGPVVLGFFFFLALGIGIVMVLILLGLAGGFNLMYPTIAVEGSDSFDAISRSISYTYHRPWRLIGYFLVAVIYGAITYLFARYVIWLVLALTHYFVGWWLTGQAGIHWNLIWPLPSSESPLPYSWAFDPTFNFGDKLGADLIAFWVYLFIALLGAFAISFYFSASTIVYVLMRAKVDATDLDDVYLPEDEDEFGETGVEKIEVKEETTND